MNMRGWVGLAVGLALAACGGGGSDESGGGETSNGDDAPTGGSPATGGSAGDDGDDGAGSGSASGSASGSGASTVTMSGTESGSTAADDSGSADDGPVLDPCPRNAPEVIECPEVGALCELGPMCCRCIDFDEPTCGFLWDCAQTDNNAADCPAEPPVDGESCDMNNLSCSYCAPDGPRFFHCGVVNPGVDPPYAWSEAETSISCSS
jgi:hypothetical protein